jgi:hypothetical protein
MEKWNLAVCEFSGDTPNMRQNQKRRAFPDRPMRYNEYAGDHILRVRDAFHLYRRNNTTKSQTAFSRRILGMQPSYYSCALTRNRQPSRRVLETLLSVTKTIMGTFGGNPISVSPRRSI